MSRPNLLFIFTDEQRADTMAAYGNTAIRAPHLNALAAESVVFERAYVSQAVCTPSRSTIMTGLCPHSSGCTGNNIPLPADVPTLVELGDFAGYRTGYNGKWHLGDEVFGQHGFDDWVSVEDMYRYHYSEGRDTGVRSSYCEWLVAQGLEPPDELYGGVRGFNRGTAARQPEPLCKPAFQAQEACRFLRENSGGPFALFVNFLEPHMPFFGPCDSVHDPAEVTLPPNFLDPVPETDSAVSRGKVGKFFDSDHPSEAEWREMIARYWGLVTQVDTAVGTILDTLRDCGLDDNTIVVFTSDHGDMMGSHQMITKTVDYEEALRVPLLMRVPGLAPRRVADPVGQVDLVPTLLDLMGQGVPAGLDGFSWAPMLGGTGELAETDVFAEWHEPGGRHELDRRCVVTREGWKLIQRADGRHQLYHLAEDPHETCDLYAGAGGRAIARDLAERIRAWQTRTGDVLDLPMP